MNRDARRRRPRRLLVVTGLTVLAYVAWRAGRAATGEPQPVVDYGAALLAVAADAQPPGEDAWPLLLDVLGRVRSIEDAEGAPQQANGARPGGFQGPIDYSAVCADPYAPSLMQPERRALERMRSEGVFDDLARIAACPRARRPLEDTPSFHATLPNLGPTRGLAKARVASMRIAAVEGDEAERVTAFEQTLALARVIGAQWTILDRLVGMAITALALEELRCELAEGPLDPATGRALLAAMDRQLALPPLAVSFECERIRMLDMIQWSFADDGHGDGRPDPQRLAEFAGATGINPSLGGRLASMILAGRRETTALVNEFMDGMILDSTLAPSERPTKGFDEAAFWARLGFRHAFVQVMIPTLPRVIEQQDATDLDVASTRVMLGIEIFRAVNGRLPSTLDELVPEILAELPADPINGLRFGYKLTPGAADGAPYALYSLGFDAADDGQFSLSADDLHEQGVDVLLNDRRPVRSEP